MRDFLKGVFGTTTAHIGFNVACFIYQNYGFGYAIIPVVVTLLVLYLIIKPKKKTKTFAQHELHILEKTVPDAVILEFKDEILALCQAFGKSGQSGGSAPYVASALSQAIQKLCLHQPIGGITGAKEEWYKPLDDQLLFQNTRCSAVFKDSDDARCYYLDAVVFKDAINEDSFTGKVEDISSRQYIKSFPFEPKSFYIDVIQVNYDEKVHQNKYYEDRDGTKYVYEIKDRTQLEEVFDYYDKIEK